MATKPGPIMMTYQKESPALKSKSSSIKSSDVSSSSSSISNSPTARKLSSLSSYSPWIRKPLWSIDTDSSSSSQQVNSEGDQHHDHNNSLTRHLSLFDLVSVGVGGTIGSGIFVLCGLIAKSHAGPATFLSWAIAGVVACLSGSCFAELSGRLPTAGSCYAYSYVSMGELPAFISAGFLTLEYLFSGSAVARSWGDKVVEWLIEEVNAGDWVNSWLNPGYGVNPMAFVVSVISVALLMDGVKESKTVTNIFTMTKVGLVIFMTVGGFCLAKTENLTPLIPKEFGWGGVLRGATSCFFGYIGYDEVCCIAGEAINPKKNMPRAVMLTIGTVTLLYILAALSLTSMQDYRYISETSGFPEGFRSNGVHWAAQLTAAGEVFTLPIVVLITLMAQPRLQFALAQDGLLPKCFAEIDATGNLAKGTLYSGILMTFVATFVPFTYLNDLISGGILIAFSMTDCCVVLLKHEAPVGGDEWMVEKLLLVFNGLSFVTGLVVVHVVPVDHGLGTFLAVFGVATSMYVCWYLYVKCPRALVFGGKRNGTFLSCKNDNNNNSNEEDGEYFETPFVPFLPMLGSFVNWYLVAQLEFSALVLLVIYIGLTAACYFMYGAKHSVGNNRGWANDYQEVKGLVDDNGRYDDGFQNVEGPFMERVISLPRVRKDGKVIT